MINKIKNNEIQFINYKGEEIMYEPNYSEYFVNDEQFNSLEEAKYYIDNGSPMSQKTITAYRKGAFAFGGDFQSQVYNDGGMVDTKLTVSEVQKIAEATANALGSKFSVTKGSVDIGTFDLDYDGERYDGGSYLIMQNGDVVNVAIRERPIYYNYKTKNKFAFGGDFQAGVYAKGGSLEAHGIKVGDTFVKTISGVIQKVRDKDGKIVYIDLSNGERDAQPPLPFDNGGGIGMEEDIDLTDDNVMRVRKPAMPEKKLTEQEWAEKHNAGAYEYMGKTKMATGGGLKDEVYIKYLNKDKNFKEDIKYFKSYDEARKWGRENLEKFNSDMINYKYEKGGALVGNQKRIDMNKNGKIDAEDFKLLRSSMNGAWRNERKHVNHSEDYEVRYAKPRPSRTGYKGKRKFADGGKISSSERFLKVVAKNYKEKRVEPKRKKVAGKVKPIKKAESGTAVKKGNRGGVMVLAKKIRKDGESWKDALKRAGQQMK